MTGTKEAIVGEFTQGIIDIILEDDPPVDVKPIFRVDIADSNDEVNEEESKDDVSVYDAVQARQVLHPPHTGYQAQLL